MHESCHRRYVNKWAQIGSDKTFTEVADGLSPDLDIFFKNLGTCIVSLKCMYYGGTFAVLIQILCLLNSAIVTLQLARRWQWAGIRAPRTLLSQAACAQCSLCEPRSRAPREHSSQAACARPVRTLSTDLKAPCDYNKAQNILTALREPAGKLAIET